jgi:hypothetical protein
MHCLLRLARIFCGALAILPLSAGPALAESPGASYGDALLYLLLAPFGLFAGNFAGVALVWAIAEKARGDIRAGDFRAALKFLLIVSSMLTAFILLVVSFALL